MNDNRRIVMVKLIVLEGEVHSLHPEEEFTTFCGIDTNRSEAEHIASGVRYADDFMSEVASRHDAERCSECLENGREWAEPDDN